MHRFRTATAVPSVDGNGAEVRRVMPTYRLSYVDPFLLMDHFVLEKPAGFPSHPHRGFEIITYMLEGAFEHRDSAGHAGIISAGGLQRINAGRGIIHSEFPAAEGINSGLQLWINLRRSDKGMEPSYQDVKTEEIPQQEADGVRIRTLVGEGSPVCMVRPMVYYDIAITGGKSGQFTVPAGYQSLLYILEGRGRFGDGALPGMAGEILVPERSADPETLHVAAEEHLRFVLLAGEPTGEQPIFRGSFVD